MSDSRLKVFQIKNLFNQFDVCIPIDNNINIFLGENGMGKTTILNCLYCVLSGNVENLSTVLFEEIILTLSDGQKLSLNRSDLVCYMEEYIYERAPYRRRRINFEHIFSEKETVEILNSVFHDSQDSDLLKKYAYKLSDVFGMPVHMAFQELERYAMQYSDQEGKGNYKNIITFKKEIENKLSQEILYFPTYRRIEEDISKLGIDIEKDKVKNRLIKFGMTDVEKATEKILSTIRSIAINSFAKLTGVLLTQYLDGDLVTHTTNPIDLDKLSIALARVGDEIAEQDKDRIIKLAASGDIYNNENKYLLNLIERLIDSYEKQNAYDERVKKFVSVCNGYLNGKSYIYDESNLELGIFRDNTKTPISIQNLSSGEKQVISLFSKLYLEETENCFILFDEPELSLSIKWQAKFLPDIMDSGRCSTLVAVTHSPFIFDNAYDELARDMGECLIERK